jgi:hypothetical protein
MVKLMIKQFKREEDGSITVSVNLQFEGSMLEMEENIAQAVNELGKLATVEALKKFDTDGQAIVVENKKYTSKGRVKKNIRPPTDKQK